LKAEKLTALVQANTREYERLFRLLDRECAEASTVRLDLEMKIHDKLKEFAGLQLGENVTVGGDAGKQLEMRVAEEQSMRDQLTRVEDEIRRHLVGSQLLNDQLAACKEIADGILSADPEYVQRFQTHLVERDNLASRQAIYAEVEGECERKLPAFEESRFYNYLKAVGYGSAHYAGFGVARLIDRWIAKLCNFPVNAASETMLLAMRSEASRRAGEGASQVELEATWLKEREHAVGASSGVPKAERECAANAEAIARGKARANDIQASLKEYAECRDFRYVRARDMLSEALAGKGTEELMTLAKQTSTPKDDELAIEVQALRHQLESHNASYAALFERRREAEEAYTRAKVLERELRSDKYTGRQYQYKSDLDVDSLLLGYMAGSMNSNAVAQAVRANQEVVEYRPPTSGYSTYGGSSSSRSSSVTSTSSYSRNNDDDTFRSSSSSSSGSGYSTSDSSDGGNSSYTTSDSF